MDQSSAGWNGRRPRKGCTGCCARRSSTACPSGGQLRERDIADDLGSQPVAPPRGTDRLEEEGLIVKIPFRGAFVRR